MLIFGALLLIIGILAILAAVGVISLADSTARDRLLAKRSFDEVVAENKRFKMIQTSALASKIYRPKTLKKLEHNLTIAGHPAIWTVRNVMIGKVMLPIVAMYFLIIAGFLTAGGIMSLISIVVIVVCWFVPNILVGARGTERTNKIDMALPDMLDKLYIALKAGMGFDAALSEALRSSKGPLADELTRVVQDTQVGLPRRDAYEALQNRTKSKPLHNFIRAVQQAEEKGTSIAGIVEVQAVDLRIARRLRAEGKAQQVSVKLLAPLMTCIFPVIFVVIIGPVILDYLTQ